MTSHFSAIRLFGILAVVLGTTFAAIIPFGPCEYLEEHGPSQCTIHELRVEPCKKSARSKDACRIRRGHNASIEFDYTANFDGDELKSSVYWVKDLGDAKFVGMESDACKSTPCPIVSGQKRTYAFQMLVKNSYPLNFYKVKWHLENSRKQDCCFTFDMELA